MEVIQKEYYGFKKMILNDYPYELLLDDFEFYPIFSKIYSFVLEQHSRINNKFFSKDENGIINFVYLDHYLIFCYRLANYLYKEKLSFELAEAIYYSSRIRTGTDLYYIAEIGDYFLPVHSIGTVMDSHATYGKLFKIYNGVHIGPYNIIGIDPKDWKHPRFGDGVTLLANCSVFGNTEIGDNVIVSVGSMLINEKIPSNCIVLGQSPKLGVIPISVSNFDLLNKKN